MGKSLEHKFDQLVRDRRKSLLVILLLAAAAYANIFANGYVLMDLKSIVDWPLIQNLVNVPRFFVGFISPQGEGVYSPLKTFFQSLIYVLSGGSPTGFHVAAVLTQFAGAYVVYKIVTFLTDNEFISFFTALLFALHPVHVEAITPMSGVADTLGLVFLLFAFYHYVKAVGYEDSLVINEQAPSTGRALKQSSSGWFDLVSLTDYRRSIVFAFLAVFTNEMAFSLPVLFFFYDHFFSRSARSLRFSCRRAVPFLFIVLFYVLIKSIVLGGIGQGRYLGDSFYLTMMLMVKAWAKYLWLLLFPVTLTYDQVISNGIFSFNPRDFDSYAVLSQSLLDPQTFLSFAVVVAVIVAGCLAWPKRPLITFSIGWLLISLLPASNLVPGSVYFGERYLYLGSLGFCFLLSYGIYQLYTRQQMGNFPVRRSLVLIAVIALIVFYSARTVMRNRDWKNSLTIYEAAVKANPKSAFLRNDLGIAYFQAGQLEKARDSFEKAIAINPKEPHFYFSADETYANLEQFDTSIAYIKKAIELNPQFAEAYFNLAGIYAFLGKDDESHKYLQKAVELYKQQNRIFEAGQSLELMESYLKIPKGLPAEDGGGAFKE